MPSLTIIAFSWNGTNNSTISKKEKWKFYQVTIIATKLYGINVEQYKSNMRKKHMRHVLFEVRQLNIFLRIFKKEKKN